MDKWLFITATDVNDGDYRYCVNEINDIQELNKVKEIFNELYPYLYKHHELSKYLDKIYREDEEKFGILGDYLNIFDDYGDNFAHTLKELQLVKIDEEYKGEN